MAVNKNFVVKNGLEVNETLILANATNNQVGIGTSLPAYTLHVNGGIGVTEAYISGITTIGGDFSVAGVSTIASAGGITTTGGDLWVGNNLNVKGDIVYDEVTGRNLNITGVGTIASADINAGDVSISALNVAGLSTQTRISNTDFVGTSATITRLNATDIVGTSATFTTINATTITGAAQIGLASEGTYIGAGASIIDFSSSNGTAWTVTTAATSGVATVTVTPGASIGLAIALGG